MRRILEIAVFGAAMLAAAAVAAADFSGTFTTTNAYGQPIRLVLQQDADGEIAGSLQASGLEFVVEAELDGNRIEGFVSHPQSEGDSYLQAEFRQDRLHVIVIDIYNGVPDPATQQAFLFDRVDGSQGAGQGGLSQGLAGGDPAAAETIARGQGGALTEGGFDAYVEALEFCLREIGNPTRLDTATRARLRQNMIDAYPGMPAEMQRNLANSETIWAQYRQSWPTLSLDEKKEFAFGVLALAYGEEAAAQALGVQPGGSTSGGSKKYDSYYSSGGAGGYGSYASDGECSYFSSGGVSVSTCD